MFIKKYKILRLLLLFYAFFLGLQETHSSEAKESKDSLEGLDKKMQALSLKVSVPELRPLSLTRTDFDEWTDDYSNWHLYRDPYEPYVVARYTQKLVVQDQDFPLLRKNTEKHINYTWEASQRDHYRNHLLAQGFCYGSKTLNEAVMQTNGKTTDWVSSRSTAESSFNYYVRKSTAGHSELQFIEDMQNLWTKNADSIVQSFMPPKDDKENVYTYGFELFGTFDMCDGCLEQLREFKKEQQYAQGFSRRMRDELRDRFKGHAGDDFIIIYHSKFPYASSSYDGENNRFSLRDLTYCGIFGTEQYNFILGSPDVTRKLNPHIQPYEKEILYSLSQEKSLSTESDMIYGYIHHLSNTTVQCQSGRFSFP
ncbi:hypothetical protein [Candidatus Finniella inopinata]|uniref:Uncharacterized protein n=1 Tax=Candidatus Finniella inopinata TaxID=1696036 RepID=A0A4Q7DKU2_9PROT|nr:hypothetical protein [Candidatus Finniella inopinata]RZI45306.1 hypothetical protein EQU50_07590 [Candidatus Finniella inopinata]